MWVRKTIFQWLVLLLGFVVIIGCSGSNNNEPSQKDIDKLLEQAFAAIKSRDWAKYQELTITSADFILKQQGISKFKEKQTYLGGSLKPEEINQQLEQFQQAKNAPEELKGDMISFDEDTYVSAGKIVDQGVMPTIGDIQIPYKIYTIKVKSSSGKVMDDLYPYFVVVQWGSYPMILKMLFPEREIVDKKPAGG
jgi:hypothetical protein